MEDDIVRGQDGLDPRSYRPPSLSEGRESGRPEAGRRNTDESPRVLTLVGASPHPSSSSTSANRLDSGQDEVDEDGHDIVREALPAADDVLDLLVLDVDDDDLGDDLDTLVSAKSTLEEASTEGSSSGKKSQDDTPGSNTPDVTSPERAENAPARPPEYYKGLVKRLEPFAQLVVAVDPRDPDGQSQIRERITAIERFRADIRVSPQVGADQAPPLADKDSGPLFCRICRDTDGQGGGGSVLVAPCRCRGSVARVHVGCLERWLAESDSTSCELCGHLYTTVRTPSYNVLASIPAWLISNGNSDLLFDFVAFLIFTPVALLGTHLGLSADDSAYFQVSLMAAIDLVYSAWLAMRVHYHAMRWYSWWRRKCTVKIILDPEESKDRLTESS